MDDWETEEETLGYPYRTFWLKIEDLEENNQYVDSTVKHFVTLYDFIYTKYGPSNPEIGDHDFLNRKSLNAPVFLSKNYSANNGDVNTNNSIVIITCVISAFVALAGVSTFILIKKKKQY